MTDPAYQAHLDRSYLATAPAIVRCATCDAPMDGPTCMVCEHAQLNRLLETIRTALTYQLTFKAPGALSPALIDDLARNLAQVLLVEPVPHRVNLAHLHEAVGAAYVLGGCNVGRDMLEAIEQELIESRKALGGGK